MAKAPLVAETTEKVHHAIDPSNDKELLLGSVPIKEAYSKWLSEMTTQAPRKRKSKKKSMQLAALRHLQQPTESSSKKLFSSQSSPAVVPPATTSANDAAAVAAQQEAQRRRFQLLANEANYAHYQYEVPWSPGLAFFALLASHAKSAMRVALHRGASSNTTRSEIPNFPVRVPPTVLRLSESDGVVLFFTTEQQHHPHPEDTQSDGSTNPKPRQSLRQNNNHTSSGATERTTPTAAAAAATYSSAWSLQFHFFRHVDAFESRVPWILRVLVSCPDASDGDASVVAVLKTAPAGSSSSDARPGNRVEPLVSVSAVEQALRSLWEHDHQQQQQQPLKAVQTYVRSKGSGSTTATADAGRAWIARPAYRKKDQHATTVWILTSSSIDLPFATTEWPPSMAPPCQIVKCATAQSWQEPRVIVETLCEWLDLQVLRPMGMGALAELVVDLVQDAQGHWCLLQVKALQLRRSQLPLALPTLAMANKSSSSRARSAPDRLETMSVSSACPSTTTTTTTNRMTTQPRAKWKCAGKYCHHHDGTMENGERVVVEAAMAAEPSGFLTKKELLSCEFYDKYSTSDDASLSSGCTGGLASALAFYLQHGLHKRDRTALYEPQPLCSACIKRYYGLRTQCTTHMELETPAAPEGGGGGGVRKATRKPQLKKIGKSKSEALLPTGARRTLELQALPSVATLRSAQSTTDMAASPVAVPSYLDELDRIERLLNGESEPQDPPPRAAAARVNTTTEMAVNGSFMYNTTDTASTTTTLSWLQDSKRDDRVDEMWQSVKLRPLLPSSLPLQVPLSLPLPATTLSNCTRPYNTFSLQAALREGAVEAATRQHTLPSPAARQPSTPPHLVSITDCRRVFSDEMFRDSLVRETVRRLIDVRQDVRLVVLPADGHGESESGESVDSTAMARMALRSIALDVAQLLDQEGVAHSGSSGSLPPILDDAAHSGCMSLTMPAPY